jgi:hypothetical protein
LQRNPSIEVQENDVILRTEEKYTYKSNKELQRNPSIEVQENDVILRTEEKYTYMSNKELQRNLADRWKRYWL